MIKQIENIFTKKRTKHELKCPNPKTEIVVDTRESQSLISANLIEQKANISHELLEIGDYLINDTIIERKTFQDFIASIIDKRLIEQLKEMKKYPNHFLILEGFYYNYNDFNIHANAIRGMLLSITNDFDIPIIYTENEKDTATFLILTAKRYERKKTENSLRQTKTAKTKEEQKQFIIEGFPGIGPKTAKILLKKFETLDKIFNLNENKLKTILDKTQLKQFTSLLKS